MIRKIFLIVPLIIFSISANGQEKITEELKKNANAIILEDRQVFNIIDDGHAVFQQTMKVMILNKSGKKYSVMGTPYDPLTPIKEFEVKTLGPGEKKARKFKSSEIKDVSYVSNFSVFEDDRIKYVDPEITTFPTIVEFSYEQEFDGLFIYPSWSPMAGENLSVLQSTFEVHTPQDFPLQIDSQHVNKHNVSLVNGRTVHEWKIENVSSIKGREKLAPSLISNFPRVKIAPRTFTYENTKGELDSWSSFGEWIVGLNEESDDLPASTITEIRALTSKASTNLEKAQIVYQYVQDKVRYVSIQLGIGGFQPMKASLVDEKSYGDCKALSFYTHSLMKAVGVKSHYALVKAGDSNYSIKESFISSQFNHVILCLPEIDQDTVWLECTSQSAPFGYLGDFTGNRKALLIDKGQSHLVNTTNYLSDDNSFERSTKINVSGTNLSSASLETVAKAKGYQYDRFSYWVKLTEKERRETFLKRYGLMTSELIHLNIELNKQYPLPSVDVDFLLQVNEYAKTFEEGGMYPIYPYADEYSLPKRYRSRTQPFEIKYPYTDSDTLYFNLTEGVELKEMPADIFIDKDFGKYRLSFEKVNEQQIKVLRILTMNKGIYPAELYSQYYLFWKKVLSNDHQKFWISRVEKNEQSLDN
ncbi:DUF3857 domain-containing protein [Flammeovirga sp. SubArs3]|uniref:DUF3857 domain-containing protein n=1 Tax=Flammeovirga sp. SubArs3 TaxID=2995316 RepID=UPI00248B5FF5|nr:DUF3857 domain-containing protein [Flammeovirga sp. SubArs3]